MTKRTLADRLTGGRLSLDLAGKIVDGIAEEFERKPPTIAVIGVSGVGKSSTINALFKTSLPTSATVRGTNRFTPTKIALDGRKVLKKSVSAALKVYDSVGLGEDVAEDPRYLARYREHLGKCDCALWVASARNRAVALDQSYMIELKTHLPNLVVGLNQADLVEPMDWRPRFNLPSEAQERHMAEIVADRRARYARVLEREEAVVPVVSYSAKRCYNLSALFLACLNAAPESRRWMFQIIKGFSAKDWLDLAEGASEEERAALARQFSTPEEGPSLWSLLASRMGLSASTANSP
ncbi:MAG: GTPase [Pseudomonadota bacterium]